MENNHGTRNQTVDVEQQGLPESELLKTKQDSTHQPTVNLFTAYILWLTGGIWGLHHAYLGRPYQAVLWYSSMGYFGWGWLRDAFFLPYYVRLARSDPNNAEVKIRAVSMAARNGVPSISVLRLCLMYSFGSYFGKAVSCILMLDEFGDGGFTSDIVYTLLGIIGTAIGVGMVANIGEETLGDGSIRQWMILLVCCLIVPVFNIHEAFGGMAYAVYSRRYRPSMTPSTRTSTRIMRHFLGCATISAVLVLGLYNHGQVNVNGRKLYFSDAAWNALNSDFWETFSYEEFRDQERRKEDGNNGHADYLKWTFDLEGERKARRTLGVSLDATHADVKAAYKKLALKYHPDKIASDASPREVEATKKQFIQVQDAYEIMSGIEKRKKSSSRQHQHDEM